MLLILNFVVSIGSEVGFQEPDRLILKAEITKTAIKTEKKALAGRKRFCIESSSLRLKAFELLIEKPQKSFAELFKDENDFPCNFNNLPFL